MTRDEVAQRLGVPPHAVRDVAEHPEGQLVTMVGGLQYLVTATVCRPYMEQFDGELLRGVVSIEDEAVRVTEPAPRPRARSRKGTS